MNKLFIDDNVDFKDKNVLLRVDFNVPINDKLEITNHNRIKSTIPTIKYLLKQKINNLIIVSHLGRPKGKEIRELSLNLISDSFVKVMNIKEITVLPYCRANVIENVLKEKKNGSITMMENIRFYPEEEENNEEFAKELSSIADIYVNDAFSVSHRKHLSTYALSNFLPSYIGRSLELELTMLNKINENIDKPVMSIIGGSKVSTKIDLLKSLVQKVDYLVIGGAMANTFLLEKGINIGKSMVEPDKIDVVKTVLEKAKENNCSVIIPKDVIVSKNLEDSESIQNIELKDMQENLSIFDIGEKTIEEISNTASDCKTIFWNGPAGYYENKKFLKGTRSLALTISDKTRSKQLISIVGGGDTIAAIKKAKIKTIFTHLSTAGGAFLESLEGKELPAIKVLKR